MTELYQQKNLKNKMNNNQRIKRKLQSQGLQPHKRRRNNFTFIKLKLNIFELIELL